MDLFLIRHGESFNNALEDASLRVADPELTDKGTAQIARVAEFVGAGLHLYPGERDDGRPGLDTSRYVPLEWDLAPERPFSPHYSDFNADATKRRSTNGHTIHFIGENTHFLLDWQSCIQHIVTVAVAEAEIISLRDGAKALLGILPVIEMLIQKQR